MPDKINYRIYLSLRRFQWPHAFALLCSLSILLAVEAARGISRSHHNGRSRADYGGSYGRGGHAGPYGGYVRGNVGGYGGGYGGGYRRGKGGGDYAVGYRDGHMSVGMAVNVTTMVF